MFIPNFSADMFLALDKDTNGTLSKQELREYADATLADIFIERGKNYYHNTLFRSGVNFGTYLPLARTSICMFCLVDSLILVVFVNK